MLEQTARGVRPYAGDFQQLGRAIANLPALAMEGHSEAVRLVADHLDQVEHWRMVIEGDGIFLLAVNVENFLALGDCRQRLVDDFNLLQRLSRSVQLSQAAID